MVTLALPLRKTRRIRWLIGCMLLAVACLNLVLMPLANAAQVNYTEDQLRSLGIYFIDQGVTGSGLCAPTSLSLPSGSTGSTTIWNSGLQPPYILQQFMIEVLKDIAQKESVPEAQAVTAEHVLALVAFAQGEGGDITNDDLFNPLNSGIDAPELVAGTHAGNGVQSFKSFDAGVEATARALTDSNHTRLAAALTNTGISAEQFMNILTYYQNYPGNAIWAEASSPPNQDKYYHRQLGFVQTVRSHYGDIASLVIGTPAQEELENLTAPSKLDTSLIPAGSSGAVTNPTSTDSSAPTTGDTSSCPSSAQTTDNNVTSGSVGNIGSSSDTVACAAGTKDLGIVDSLYRGALTSEAGHLRIRLCQLSSIGGVGNDTSGQSISGGAVVNARVSGAFQGMGLKAAQAGVQLSATSSFRLADSCGGTGDGTLCASPGSSVHQLGAAIDFAGTHLTGSSNSNCSGRARDPSSVSWNWLYNNADGFGIKQYTYESWHWDVAGGPSRCGLGQ